MYQNIHIQYFGKRKCVVHLWDDEKGYQTFDFWKYGWKKDPNGDYFTIHGDRVKRTTNYTDDEMDSGEILETDVMTEIRLLSELYDSDDVSKGHNQVTYDIEVDMTESIPNVETAQNKITAVGLHESLTDEYSVFLLDESGKVNKTQEGNVSVIPFYNEEDLLMAFLTKWEEIRPTIVTGWNIDKFDTPYLYRRLVLLFGEKIANRLSPIGSVYYNQHRDLFDIAGISFLDYMWLYKNFTFQLKSSYSLDAISNDELGRGKIKYSGTLDQLLKENIDKFVRYNITDVELVVELDRKLGFIELARGICHKGRVPYQNIYFSSRWIDGAILVFLRRNKQVAPNKKKAPEKTNKFSGAYVKLPEPNLYEWVYDLDFTSLYPSIIMSLNISPETKVGKIHNWNNEDFIRGVDKNYMVEVMGEDAQMNPNELQKFFDESKFSIASNGVMYRTDIKGVIPSILEEWFKEKTDYDELMKKYGSEGDKEKAKYYKDRRTIAKVMLNSVYGVLGLPSFRFYDIDNAEAVTLTGQSLIKYTQMMGNHYYNKVLGTDADYCIYIDTDSVTGDSVIDTDVYGKIPVEDLFEEEKKKLKKDKSRFVNIQGKARQYVFPENTKSLTYDELHGEVLSGNIHYIERHKVKREIFLVKVSNGSYIGVTKDHSVMVLENDKLVEKKPSELKIGDKVLTIKED